MPQRALMRPATLGLLFALASAVGFSAKSILIKGAYRYGVDAETLMAMRMLYALPFFIAMACYAQQRDPRRLSASDWRELVVLGFFGYYAASYADFLALQYISAALARVVLFTYPAMVVILTALLQRHWPAGRVLAALALSYAGVMLAVLHDHRAGSANLSLGVALAITSAICFAVYLLRCGASLQRLGATRVTALATGIASLMTLLQFVVLRQPASLPAQPWQVHGYALAMAVFSTVAPIWLSSQAIRRIGASHTAIISSAGPIITMLLAWALLAEPVSAAMLVGAVLVVAGVRLVARQPAIN